MALKTVARGSKDTVFMNSRPKKCGYSLDWKACLGIWFIDRSFALPEGSRWRAKSSKLKIFTACQIALRRALTHFFFLGLRGLGLASGL